MATIATLQKMHLDSLEYTRKHAPFLFPVNNAAYQQSKNLTKSAKTFNQLILAAGLAGLPQHSIGFRGVKPLTGSADSHICFEFDQSAGGWYFMYGEAGSMRFTYLIFRTAVSVTKHGADDVIYSVVGGFDDGIKGWVPIPLNASPAKYSCTDGKVEFTYNSSNVSSTFSISNDKNRVINGTVSPTTTKTPSNIPNFSFILNAQEAGKYNSANGGCVPICFGGAGTSYWSYTKMTCTISNKTTSSNPKINQGTGWFDHQWLSGGIPRGLFQQLLYSWTTGGDTQLRWLWFTMQLDDGRQFMGSVVGIKESRLPLKKGDSFTTHLSKYHKDDLRYGIKTTLKVLETVKYEEYTFPTSYEIKTSEGETFYLTTSNKHKSTGSGGFDIVNLPIGSVNWEGPGVVTSSVSGKPIGTGFLEANNLLTNAQLIKRVLSGNGMKNTSLQLYGVSGTRGKIITIGLGVLLLMYSVGIIFLLVFVVKQSRK